MEREKSLKITNVKQFECLVGLMEKNSEIARGFAGFTSTKADYKNAWKEFSVPLNSLGPPTRDGEGWLKVWTDFKAKIKRKMQHNNKELKATGGGQNKLYYFSTLEESVISLLSLEKLVNPGGRSFGLSESISETPSEVQDYIDEILNEDDISNPILPSNTGLQNEIPTKQDSAPSKKPTAPPKQPSEPNKSKKEKMVDERHRLLEEQTKCLKNIDENMKVAVRYMRKNFELKQKKFGVYKEYLDEKLKLRKEKNDTKLKLFNYKVQQLGLKEIQFNKECD